MTSVMQEVENPLLHRVIFAVLCGLCSLITVVSSGVTKLMC